MNRLSRRAFLRRKPLLVSAGVILFLALGNGVFWFIIPQLAREFTESMILVGAVVALPALFSVFADIPLGDLSDRVGESLVIKAGFFGLIVVGLMFSHVTSLASLVLFLIVFGFLIQMVHVPLAAHVMEISPPKERSGYFGAYLSMLNLGFALGPVVAGVLIGVGLKAGLYPASVFYAILCLLALVLAHTSLRDALKPREKISEGVVDVVRKDKLVVKSLLDFKKLREVGVTVLALSFLFTFFDGLIWTLTPIYYSQLNVSSLVGGLILTAFILPLVLLDYPAGVLADRHGRKKTLTLGLIIAGVSAILFSQASTPLGLLSTAFLTSIGLALFWPSVEGVLADASRDDERGEVTGVWESSMNMGYVAGPLFAGVVSHYASIPTAFSAAGVLILLSIVLVRRIH